MFCFYLATRFLRKTALINTKVALRPAQSREGKLIIEEVREEKNGEPPGITYFVSSPTSSQLLTNWEAAVIEKLKKSISYEVLRLFVCVRSKYCVCELAKFVIRQNIFIFHFVFSSAEFYRNRMFRANGREREAKWRNDLPQDYWTIFLKWVSLTDFLLKIFWTADMFNVFGEKFIFV